MEDDPDGQELVSHVIGYLNIPHVVVSDGEAASKRLFASGESFRVVISIDLALPGKDGRELLAEIREHKATAQLTCVAVTAFHTSVTREKALRVGSNAYFAKPLDADYFARELESLL